MYDDRKTRDFWSSELVDFDVDKSSNFRDPLLKAIIVREKVKCKNCNNEFIVELHRVGGSHPRHDPVENT